MMSKKIFSAQDWENVPSEIQQAHTPSIAPIYNKVEDDVESVVREIEQCAIDIAPHYKDWVELGFALVDGLGENGREYYHRISRFYPTYQRKKRINNIRIVCTPKGKALLSVLSSIWQINLESHWLRSVKSIYPFYQISKMVKRVNG